ncbi:hypothetical protein KGM_205193 [Danaus plexippus plexippus]|uniref:ZAD domain-containing protein n=1 Tax=Danaus plexippus plexippus TaxID=278856 RepID=A0A212FGI6_DANPL|nr:hypothetical protein KGM_205193 [Danaus plexippus plexippus]
MDLSNNNRCKCCLEERNLKDMWKEHYNEGQKEIYGFMIRDCFVVAWDLPSYTDKLEYICASCRIILRQCVRFKNRLQMSEQSLNYYFNNDIFKALPRWQRFKVVMPGQQLQFARYIIFMAYSL